MRPVECDAKVAKKVHPATHGAPISSSNSCWFHQKVTSRAKSSPRKHDRTSLSAHGRSHTANQAQQALHESSTSTSSYSSSSDHCSIRWDDGAIAMRHTTPSAARSRVLLRELRCSSLLLPVVMLLLATAHAPLGVAATTSVALVSVQECSSCDVPKQSQIPFCAEFVLYSSCRTKSSWSAMVRTTPALTSQSVMLSTYIDTHSLTSFSIVCVHLP